MPDWRKLVAARLADLRLEETDKQEVIAELSDHLEENYDGLRREGLTEGEAIRAALSQVQDWNSLQRRIRAAKELAVNARTSRLWFPSFITLAASVVTLVGFALSGLKPGPFGSRPDHEVWWGHLLGGGDRGLPWANQYTVWLMALPLLGALGACLSSRAGGTRRDIVISGVFPAVVWLTIVLIILSSAASREHGLEALAPPFGFAGLIALLVLIPGTCLLLGVLAYFALAKWRKPV